MTKISPAFVKQVLFILFILLLNAVDACFENCLFIEILYCLNTVKTCIALNNSNIQNILLL